MSPSFEPVHSRPSEGGVAVTSQTGKGQRPAPPSSFCFGYTLAASSKLGSFQAHECFTMLGPHHPHPSPPRAEPGRGGMLCSLQGHASGGAQWGILLGHSQGQENNYWDDNYSQQIIWVLLTGWEPWTSLQQVVLYLGSRTPPLRHVPAARWNSPNAQPGDPHLAGLWPVGGLCLPRGVWAVALHVA